MFYPLMEKKINGLFSSTIAGELRENKKYLHFTDNFVFSKGIDWNIVNTWPSWYFKRGYLLSELVPPVDLVVKK